MRTRPLETPEILPMPTRDPEDDAELPSESEVVAVEIRDAIDLHGFAPRDIPLVVRGYLEAALERGYAEVRLIHGKGKGVQRSHVRRLLGEHPCVDEFFDGDAHRGGWGATVVRLRPAASTKARNKPVP